MDHDEVCDEWLQGDKTQNPKTGYRVKQGAKTYNQLDNECHDHVPRAIPVRTICEKFDIHPERNPRTKRKIKEGGPTYMKLAKECWTGTLSPKKVVKKKSPPKKKTPSPKRAKTPSPKRAKTPSPKKKTPSPKKKTPSPKRAKTPSPKRAKTPSPKRAKTPSPKRAKTPSPKTGGTFKVPSPKVKTKRFLLSDRDETNVLLKLSMQNKIKFNVCDMDKDLQKLIILKSAVIPKKDKGASASETIELFLREEGGKTRRAFLKIFTNIFKLAKRGTENEAGLYFEKEVCKYITDNIIKTGQSFSFIPYLGYDECDLKSIQMKHKLKFKIPPIFEGNDKLRLCILLTGSCPSLKDFLKILEAKPEPQYPQHEIASIVFQIIYAIYVLSSHGINHNDLHLQNILLDTLDKPMNLQYNIGDKSVKFSTRYLIKIYDWDRSTRNTIKNPKLDQDSFEAELGDNNTFHHKRDFYQVICNLVSFKQFQEYIQGILHKDIEYKRMSLSGTSPVSINLSPASIQAIKTNFQPVDKHFRQSYYNISLVNLQKTISKTEFDSIMTKYKKIANKTHLYFKLTAKTLKIPAGWGCQMLNAVEDTYLPPVSNFFTTNALWLKLTEHLQKTTGTPEQICTF
jgi:hypothetical protein